MLKYWTILGYLDSPNLDIKGNGQLILGVGTLLVFWLDQKFSFSCIQSH